MPLRRSLPALALASCAAVAALSRPASADLEIELGNNDRVAGTFLPADEVETFTVRVPAGAKLSATAKGKKVKGKPTPVLDVTLLDPDGVEVGASQTVRLPTGEKVANFETSATGVHTFRLTSSAAGDYTFNVRWKVPPVVRDVLTFAGDVQPFPFVADVGSTVSVTVARAKGSRALPRILSLEADDFSWFSDPIDPPSKPNATSHAVRGIRLGGEGGGYTATLADDSLEGGDVSVTVTITPPKAKPRSVNLTAKQTGGDPLNQYGKGAVIGPDGGDLDLQTEGESVLDGTAISIPPGALGAPALIVVTTSAPITPPNGAEPAGPGVNFGPDGLQFRDTGDQVLVTIPFDASEFGDDPSALDVYVRDAKGKVSLVTPKSSYVIDPVAGTVTFPVAHFSSYQVFGPVKPRPADLNADGLDDLVVPAPRSGSDTGKVLVWFGRRDFATKPPAAPDLVIGPPQGHVGFGWSVAVGDVNGDGVADLAASSFELSEGDTGFVHVFFGGTGFAPASADDADALLTGVGTEASSFGDRVATGDVTGDGIGDLVVTAPRGSPNQTDEGSVFVFRGVSSFGSSTSAGAAVRIDGFFPDLRLGVSLAVGRLVGDDAADLVIGARGGPAASDSGTVYLIPGGASLVSGAADLLGVDYTGDQSGDEFGTAVAIGDVNEDGFGDLVVGAPGAAAFDGQQGVVLNAGTVAVFYGPDFDGGGSSSADAELGGALPQAGARRGAAVQVGNFTGSSTRDVAFGGPDRDDDSGTPADRGEAGVARGGPDFGDGLQFAGLGEAGAALGAAFLPLCDLNGDRRHDLAVAAPGAANGAGRILVSFSNDLFGSTVTLTGSAGDRLGGR